MNSDVKVFKKDFFVLIIPFTLILGVITSKITLDISNQGITYGLPYFLLITLGLILFFVERKLENKNPHKRYNQFKNKYEIRSIFSFFLSFNTLSILIWLAFITMLEVAVLTYVVELSWKGLFSSSIASDLLPNISFFIWILAVFVHLKIVAKGGLSNWVKVIRIFLLILSLSLITSAILSPVNFIDSIRGFWLNWFQTDSLAINSRSVWDISVWMTRSGLVFLFFFSLISLQIIFSSCFRHLKTSETKNTLISNLSIFVIVGLICMFFFIYLFVLTKNVENLFLREILNKNADYFVIVGVALLLVISIIFLFYLSLKSYRILTPYFSSFSSNLDLKNKFLSDSTAITFWIVSIGSSFGVLFLSVQFDGYFIWVGFLFLLLIVALYFKNLYRVYESIQLRKLVRIAQESSHRNWINVLLLFVFPILIFPLFFVSLPSIFSNFIMNAPLNKKIEYLQNLGAMSSKHYEIEPIILQKYGDVIQKIDSSKVRLNSIDSLNHFQKDSIKFYVENRNLMKNESFRFQQLIHYHEIVFVRNASRIFLFLFIVSIVVLIFYKRRKALIALDEGIETD